MWGNPWSIILMCSLIVHEREIVHLQLKSTLISSLWIWYEDMLLQLILQGDSFTYHHVPSSHHVAPHHAAPIPTMLHLIMQSTNHVPLLHLASFLSLSFLLSPVCLLSIILVVPSILAILVPLSIMLLSQYVILTTLWTCYIILFYLTIVLPLIMLWYTSSLYSSWCRIHQHVPAIYLLLAHHASSMYHHFFLHRSDYTIINTILTCASLVEKLQRIPVNTLLHVIEASFTPSFLHGYDWGILE